MVTELLAEVDLPLHKGKPPLTLNQRLHWRDKSARTALLRDWTHVKVKQLHLTPREHIIVQLHYHPGDERRRDADNLVATLKPCLDGITLSGLIKDDTPEYVTWYSPRIHNGPGKRRLWLTIEVQES